MVVFLPRQVRGMYREWDFTPATAWDSHRLKQVRFCRYRFCATVFAS
jgi:hypothetical protein